MSPTRVPSLRAPTSLLAVALVFLLSGSAHASQVIRTFRFAPDAVKIVPGPDGAEIQLRGAVPDGATGRPEVPVVPAYIALESGERILSARAIAEEWTPLAQGTRVRPAAVASPGLERVAAQPDPAVYGSTDWYPAAVGQHPHVGTMRGQRIASIELRPVRVRPSTGEIELATRITVQIETQSAAPGTVLERKRIVPEWEDEFGHGMSGLTDADLPALTHSWPRTAKIESARLFHTNSAEPFAPTNVPSVEGSPVQYLIITTAVMAPQFQRLADWHTREGTPTVVRTLEFLNSNFPYGVDQSDRVRRFIREAYLQWGTVYVLLAGDTDVLNVRYARTTFFGGAFIPADLYFADLDGTWDADGDSLFGEATVDGQDPGDALDLFPDVYIGRAAASTLAEAQTFVDKVLQYQETPRQDYEERALFLAEVLFPQGWEPPQPISLDGADDAESALSRLTPDMVPTRMYENTKYDSLGAVRLTAAAALDSLQHGWGLVHHVGHGFRNTMSMGQGTLTNPDIDGLTNGTKTFVLYSINCNSNSMDFETIGEEFTENPNGGAVANIGSSREDFPFTGRFYQDAWYDSVFRPSVNPKGKSIGWAHATQKLPFVGLSSYDNTHRWTQFVLNLLGDPAMPIHWRRPKTLTVSHVPSLTVADTQVVVTVQVEGVPLAGAKVCVMKSGEDYRVGLTDGAGSVILPLRPETTGSALVTVTASGCKPYEGTISITAAAVPAVVSRPANRLIDDDLVGGTIGNADGAADLGETIDWLLPITNVGGVSGGTPDVTGTLTTDDVRVTITQGTATYGLVGAGVTANGSPYRVQIGTGVPDGAEILFRLDFVSGTKHWTEPLRLAVRAPVLFHLSHVIDDDNVGGTTGNSNGLLDQGETVDLTITLRNNASGPARSVTATLTSSDPGISIPNGNATLGTLAPGATGALTAFRITNTSASAPRFALTVSDAYGPRLVQPSIDLVPPALPSNIVGNGAASSITLVWTKSVTSDLFGYNVYRSNVLAGPYTKRNTIPNGRISYFVDDGLPPLTRFYYRVTSVDSSGNESSQSPATSASTNPPLHVAYPLVTERTMPSSPAFANIDNSPDGSYELVVGSNIIYAWHEDGTPYRDADGSPRTSGDFSLEGTYFAASATIADLDLDGVQEIIAPSWDTKQLHVFEPDGTDKPGFPITINHSAWSTAAVGNIDADPQLEIVFGTNDTQIYAFNYDGTGVLNPDGLFMNTSAGINYCSPALADLDIPPDGINEIIFAANEGKLYAWRGNGMLFNPGYPYLTFSGMTNAPAVADLDNDGTLEIVFVAGNNKLNCINSENASNQPGFPITGVNVSGTSRQPSPAIADMDGNPDGHKEIIVNTTDGYVRVYTASGALLPTWSFVRYSSKFSGASESSPAVADINGDLKNDIVVGGEDANLYAFDNDGSVMPGFPIHLGGEVRGTPLLWDLDFDNQTDIVLDSWDKNVYRWDYPGGFSPANAPWPGWRHDMARTGRVGNPIVVSTPEAAAFMAEDAEPGLALNFALPSTGEAVGRFDVYRAEGPGPTGAIAHSLPAGFEQLNHEALVGEPGTILRYVDASVRAGASYRYMLVRRQDQPGLEFLAYGPFEAIASTEAPRLAFVTQNFPNPARGGRGTTIAYGVPGDGGAVVHATLNFYDVRGRLVRHLVNGPVPPGRYQAVCDGRDDHGAALAPGVYLYEFRAGSSRLVRKAMLVGG